MKLRFLVIVITILTIIISSYAQTIKGRLIGSHKKPVGEAVVTLLSSDSSFVAHQISNVDGSFSFSQSPSPYILHISHISYENLNLVSDKENLGDIQLIELNKNLTEIVVKAKRPVVKMKAGQLSFNAQSLLTKRPAHSAYDLLRSVPGLQVSESTGVSVHGGLGGTTILINGQQKQYVGSVEEYLKTLDPRRVESIDLAYIAPPEFGIKGASVNIVLKRNVLQDFSGFVQATYTHKKTHSLSELAALQYSKGAWGFDLSYKLDHSHSITAYQSKAEHNVQGTIHPISASWQTEVKTPFNHTLSLGLNHQATSGRRLSLYYGTSLIPRNKSTTLSDNSLLGYNLLMRQSSSYTHSLRSEYAHKGWQLGLEYTIGRVQGDYNYLQSPIAQPSYTQTQHSRRLYSYAQLSHTLGKSWSIATGLMYTLSLIDNEHQGQSQLRTEEHIGRAYLTANKSLLGGHLNLSASLIAEGYAAGQDKQIGIIPQLGLNYYINDKNALMLSYQSYHDFPSYYARLNYEQRIDGYNIYRGNPSLRTGRVDNLSLAYAFAQKYSIYLTQSWRRHARFTQMYQSYDALESIQQEHNMDRLNTLSLGINAPISLGQVASLTLSPSIAYSQARSQNWHSIGFDERVWVPIVQANAEIYISQTPRIVGLIDLFWKGTDKQAIWQMKPNWSISLGLMAIFMKNRLMLSISGSDLFETSLPLYYTRFGTQHYERDNKFYLRTITLSASYRFSTYREQSSRLSNNARLGLPNL